MPIINELFTLYYCLSFEDGDHDEAMERSSSEEDVTYERLLEVIEEFNIGKHHPDGYLTIYQGSQRLMHDYDLNGDVVLEIAPEHFDENHPGDYEGRQVEMEAADAGYY